tara:strand:+ start:304 stop:438 length:135 start_codon:yes stop_codon:yes gene_type:complete
VDVGGIGVDVEVFGNVVGTDVGGTGVGGIGVVVEVGGDLTIDSF